MRSWTTWSTRIAPGWTSRRRQPRRPTLSSAAPTSHRSVATHMACPRQVTSMSSSIYAASLDALVAAAKPAHLVHRVEVVSTAPPKKRVASQPAVESQSTAPSEEPPPDGDAPEPEESSSCNTLESDRRLTYSTPVANCHIWRHSAALSEFEIQFLNGTQRSVNRKVRSSNLRPGANFRIW